MSNINKGNKMETIDAKRVEEVRKYIWDMYKELRSMRPGKKTVPIFGVEMALMQLGVLANGMTKENKNESSSK
jgi:hypothetical protein|tara:strand:- start:434 stop:652 length:219 start_codon:yes stop_codon:yes gene_type:complete